VYRTESTGERISTIPLVPRLLSRKMWVMLVVQAMTVRNNGAIQRRGRAPCVGIALGETMVFWANKSVLLSRCRGVM
jgi:hypothetical protein